ELDERAEVAELVFLRIARGENEMDDVVADLVVHVERVDDGAGGEDLVEVDDALDVEVGLGESHGVEDAALFREVRIIDHDLEHEAVDLRLGERVGAFLVDGVFRGEHEEGDGELVGLAAEGDLPLLHGFEQGGLHLGGGAVNFVGEDEICEHRAAGGVVFSVAGVVDQRADDVRGEQVRGELHAVENGVYGTGKGAEGEGFGEAGDAFQEHVAIGHEAHQQTVDEVLLA